MAVEYRLTLAGDLPAEQVAARLMPDPADRPTADGSGVVLGVDLRNRYGFSLTVRSAVNGYVEAASEDGVWEWEPPAYVAVTFRMTKDGGYEEGLAHMLPAVSRVLASGPEDAALVQNGDWLLLTRLGGVLRKHRRAQWWDHYGFVNSYFPEAAD